MPELVVGSAAWCQQRIISEAKIGVPTVKVYGDQLSPSIRVGVAQVSSPDTQEVYLHPFLIRLMDALQSTSGRTPDILCGYMTMAYRAARTKMGLEPNAFLSPHEVGAALKLAIPLGSGTSIAARTLYRDIGSAYNEAKLPPPDIYPMGTYFTISYVRNLFVTGGGPVSSPLTWNGLAPEVRTFFSGWLYLKNLENLSPTIK
jgi:hypothetical protein